MEQQEAPQEHFGQDCLVSSSVLYIDRSMSWLNKAPVFKFDYLL